MSSPSPGRRPGVPVGRLFGVPVRLSPSFVLLGLLVADLDSTFVRFALPQNSTTSVIAVSGAIGLALLLSVTLHEVAHAAVGRGLGMPVQEITLYLFGGLTSLGGEAATPTDQALITLAGPLVNVALGGVAAAVWLTSAPVSVPAVVGHQLAVVNAGLAAYNLLPGLPLDGGQLLRAALWRILGDPDRALRGAGYGGLAAAGLTAVIGLRELLTPGGTVGLFTLSVAALVGVNAQQVLRRSGVNRRLSSVAAGQVAARAFTAAPDLPLAEALRRAEADGARAVLLGEWGNPTAVLVDALVARVPLTRRPWVPASSVARPLLPGMVLDSRLSGTALLEALRRTPATEYLVVDGPAVVGVLRVSDLAALLES
ncbi:MAG: site-2 protease family protein [Mycobacteriales bacterium]